MKRAKNLFPEIISFPNLLRAFERAQAGKRRHGVVTRFRMNLEKELLLMQRELASGTYVFGDYLAFSIVDPKPRLISAAPFRDRVLHHAFCNLVGPVLERGMIFDSYANREGKGTHQAILRYQHFSRRYAYALKADVRKFFPSIDHEILKGLLARKIGCRDTLHWLGRIIDHSNPQEPMQVYFPGDDLFTPFQRRRGLPIGNLCSQLFANFYLDGLDHFVKEKLRCPAYVRYVDDFVLLDQDQDKLRHWHEQIERYLFSLRLQLHAQKTQTLPVSQGHSFLGHRIFPGVRLLRSANLRRFRKRNRQQLALLDRGMLDEAGYAQRLTSWVAHASFSHTALLQEKIFSEIEARGVCLKQARSVSGRLLARHRTDASCRPPQPQQPPQS